MRVLLLLLIIEHEIQTNQQVSYTTCFPLLCIWVTGEGMCRANYHRETADFGTIARRPRFPPLLFLSSPGSKPLRPTPLENIYYDIYYDLLWWLSANQTNVNILPSPSRVAWKLSWWWFSSKMDSPQWDNGLARHNAYGGERDCKSLEHKKDWTNKIKYLIAWFL